MFGVSHPPIIFAHRGARLHAPENTLAAFELARAEGADGIELDAKLTADGEIVVFHDATLERTTNGSGAVAARTLAELRELDAGGWFSAEYRGQKIPLLEEVFDALGDKLLINVELKNYATPGDYLVETVCALVARCGLDKRVVFSSFLGHNLKKAGRILPSVPRALLALPGWKGAWARSFGFAFGDYASLNSSIRDVDVPQVKRVHRLSRSIMVWTVNQPDDMLRLQRWGVDGILTDDPGLAAQVLGRSV
ncbi:MAG TPA: glycerophosphodiester phosphodiesterase family protein [Anaerolineales bacterium]|nr:glycerophosphodiester phosphodiesterase family protein [Anaerolineales bacterium]